MRNTALRVILLLLLSSVTFGAGSESTGIRTLSRLTQKVPDLNTSGSGVSYVILDSLTGGVSDQIMMLYAFTDKNCTNSTTAVPSTLGELVADQMDQWGNIYATTDLNGVVTFSNLVYQNQSHLRQQIYLQAVANPGYWIFSDCWGPFTVEK